MKSDVGWMRWLESTEKCSGPIRKKQMKKSPHTVEGLRNCVRDIYWRIGPMFLACSIGKQERGGLTLQLKHLNMMANYTFASGLRIYPVYIKRAEANGGVV